MKKITFCFITIFLILISGMIGLAQGLPSLTESSPTPPPTPPTTNVTPPPVPETSSNAINIFSYADPSCNFSFNFPNNWKEYKEVEGTLKAELDFWEEGYLLASFFVYVKDTDLSLSQYAMQEEEWMMNPQNIPDYRKISEEAINIGSLPAIQRLYTYTFITNDNSKIPLKATDVYIVNNNKSYMLVGEVDQDKFDRMLTDLAIMFNSFVITEEPVSVSTAPELPPVTISDTSSITSTSSTGSEITFKFCPYCGAPLQPDYKFCPGCGKPIPVQRVIKVPKEEEARSNRRNNIDYPVNPLQTRGFSEEIDRLDQVKGMNKSINKSFKTFQPAFISRNFGSKLIRLFPEKPLFPWAVSKRIKLGNYTNLFSGSLGSKISSQNLVIKSASPTNFDFSYIKESGEKIAFNPNLGTTYRGGRINQLGSSLKNLGKGIASPMKVSRAALSEKTWVLRSSKKGAQENISMGSSIERLSSKIGSSIIKQIRSSSFLGGCFSDIGKGINPEIGIKREGEGLPSLAPTFPQTTPQATPAIPGTPPPAITPEGIVSPTPGAPAQGGITLTPPGQPVPAQPGPGGVALPTPGAPQEPQIIWKQYSLNQAFSHNPLITGYLEHPSTWLVNLDSFNRNVTFSEDASGLTSLTLFPGLMGQFSNAQDLAQQMTHLLQQQVPDLSILNQEFKIVPTPGSGAIEVTEGKINLQGNYQGTTFRFNIETYVIYTGVYGPTSGMGYVILTQASQNIFVEKEQKYFNRMILSYKRALGVVK